MPGDCRQLDKLVNKVFIDCNLSAIVKVTQTAKIRTAEARIKRTLRSLLWHLFAAMRQHPECFVRIGLTTKQFLQCEVDNPHGISREMNKIIKHLRQKNLVELYVGFIDHKTKKSKTTRLRANQALTDQLKKLPENLSEEYLQPHPIEFRKKTGSEMKVVSHKSTDNHLLDAEATIKEYNDLIESSSVTLNGNRGDFLVYQDKSGTGISVNLKRKAMKSIFHVEDDNSITYGRVHGGFWQSIPSGFRQFILIEGQETVALDYSAQIVNIMASKEKIQIQGDAYSIPLGNTGMTPDAERLVIKKMMIVLFNVDDKKRFYKAVRGSLRNEALVKTSGIKLTDDRLAKFVDAIIKHHPFLQKYAFSNQGKRLFMLDADIAREIIKAFLQQKKTVLPIHDGFIAVKEDREFLEQTMQSVWKKMFGTSIIIKEE
jgi:hypothetical protein